VYLRRAALIENIRKAKPKCFTGCWRYFSGTPYLITLWRRTRFKLLSMMQYDLYDRNHDFDNGIQGLYAQMLMQNLNFVSG
jgi:5'-nucleotidase